MKIYKDTNNKVHEIDFGFENLLPSGSTEITQAEADALLSPSPSETEVKRKLGIKAEAQKTIIRFLPSGTPDNFVIKELNLIMLNADLDDIVISGATLTAKQQTQKTSFRTLKIKIKDVRKMSKTALQAGDLVSKFKADLSAKGY